MKFNFGSLAQIVPQAIAIYYSHAASFTVYAKYHVTVTLDGTPHHLTIGEAITVLLMVSSGTVGEFQVGAVKVNVTPLVKV